MAQQVRKRGHFPLRGRWRPWTLTNSSLLTLQPCPSFLAQALESGAQWASKEWTRHRVEILGRLAALGIVPKAVFKEVERVRALSRVLSLLSTAWASV